MGGWWRWALVSPDGVAPSQMVGVSDSVNLLLQHKIQKFSSGTGSTGWSTKKGRTKMVVCVCWCLITNTQLGRPLFTLFFSHVQTCNLTKTALYGAQPV